MFITDALFEKKQTIMTKEYDIAQLQAEVEARSAEENSLTAKYEPMAIKNEGQIHL